jgi:hypothetical protein
MNASSQKEIHQNDGKNRKSHTKQTSPPLPLRQRPDYVGQGHKDTKKQEITQKAAKATKE